MNLHRLPLVMAASAGSLALASSVGAAVVLDFTRFPGATVGDDLVVNAVASPSTDSGTTFATFTLDDPGATVTTLNLDYTGEGDGPQAGANRPELRSFNEGGLGINSALANNQDTNSAIDEVGIVPGAADESLTFSFSEDLLVTAIALAGNFETGETVLIDNGGTIVPITLADTSTFDLNGESVNLFTFASPLELTAGESFTFTVGDDGDDSNRADVSVSGLIVTVIPEPASAAILAPAGLMLMRRRR
ncbi:MAG: hypothetical protein AAGI46_02345 [Planctomycetota bacterium]